jgi:hypothetical protein
LRTERPSRSNLLMTRTSSSLGRRASLPDALSVKVCWYPFYFRDDMVYIETLTAEQQLSEPDEVAVYVKAFSMLREAALFGPDAVALIQRVAAELRVHS